MAKITKKQFTSNVIISLAVQVVSVVVNLILNLIVPKFIDELQYSYWQMFVLYVGYVGIMHFGLLDGMVLRYSQYDYDELDKKKVRSQFQILFFFTMLMTVIATAVAFLFIGGEIRWIVILVGVGIMSKNIFTYSSYLFQITNRINGYAVLVLTQRGAYGVMVVALLLFHVNDFYFYCMAELTGDLVAVVVGTFLNKGLYFGSFAPMKEVVKEVKMNVSSGILLMLANWSSLLVTGLSKMIINAHWDELTFGKVSFAFSATGMFLTFVYAVSVVLFPSLKRLDEKVLPELYGNIRSAMSLLLFAVMIFYYPGCWILEKWLPKYTSSLIFLGYLLPLIIFSSRLSLLTNNYLKVYRKEFAMMVVNVISIAVGVTLFLVGAFVFDNLEFVLLSIVGVVMLNSVLSEIVVMRTIKRRIVLPFVYEVAMVLAFILATAFLSRWIAMAVYTAFVVVFFAVNYRAIGKLLGGLKKKPVEEPKSE